VNARLQPILWTLSQFRIPSLEIHAFCSVINAAVIKAKDYNQSLHLQLLAKAKDYNQSLHLQLLAKAKDYNQSLHLQSLGTAAILKLVGKYFSFYHSLQIGKERDLSPL
jgi:hypothetical protein